MSVAAGARACIEQCLFAPDRAFFLAVEGNLNIKPLCFRRMYFKMILCKSLKINNYNISKPVW
jgi:hypothetical protein